MSDLAAVAKKWHAARNRERALAAELYEAIRLAVNEGMSEVQAAKVAGVDRMTVRRALGKL
jgi:predicted DNA-binding protein (UPF0251 family)